MVYTEELALTLAKAKNNNTVYLMPIHIDGLINLSPDDLSQLIVGTNTFIHNHPEINETNTPVLYEQLSSQTATADAILGHRLREQKQINTISAKLDKEETKNEEDMLRNRILRNLDNKSLRSLKRISDMLEDDNIKYLSQSDVL
ncbi:MAG: hypothetical protein K5989_03800 [Lachnospiraceae bacterium]|nr:hypothetical protein [Lachnospiraceae bacterium]